MTTRAEVDWSRVVLDRVRFLAPVTIEGGPVVLPLADLPRLWMIPWFCDSAVAIGLHIQPPAREPLTIRWPRVEDLQTTAIDRGAIQAGFPWRSDRAQIAALEKVAGALAQLPDGTFLELATAAEEAGPGAHRYQGPIRRGDWHLEASAPAVDCRTLEAALDLCREADGPIRTRDSREAQRVVAMTRRSQWLADDIEVVESAGTLDVEAEYRRHLAMVFFRLRFLGVWDVAMGLAEADETGPLAL
jgi:hypothetical protein